MSTSLVHVMPSDSARLGAVQATAENLVAFGFKVWEFLNQAGKASSRESVRSLVRDTAATRPQLADAMRRAGHGNWS
ncbi:MAG: hypothetical protein IV097_15655 [Burkholderiaceae bacterium]|nr:hypothetical protein [Burkholderiaceae bacterium]